MSKAALICRTQDGSAMTFWTDRGEAIEAAHTFLPCRRMCRGQHVVVARHGDRYRSQTVTDANLEPQPRPQPPTRRKKKQ